MRRGREEWNHLGMSSGLWREPRHQWRLAGNEVVWTADEVVVLLLVCVLWVVVLIGSVCTVLSVVGFFVVSFSVTCTWVFMCGVPVGGIGWILCTVFRFVRSFCSGGTRYVFCEGVAGLVTASA